MMPCGHGTEHGEFTCLLCVQDLIQAEREACAAILDTAADFFERRAAEDPTVAPIMKAAASNARGYASLIRARP